MMANVIRETVDATTTVPRDYRGTVTLQLSDRATGIHQATVVLTYDLRERAYRYDYRIEAVSDAVADVLETRLTQPITLRGRRYEPRTCGHIHALLLTLPTDYTMSRDERPFYRPPGAVF